MIWKKIPVPVINENLKLITAILERNNFVKISRFRNKKSGSGFITLPVTAQLVPPNFFPLINFLMLQYVILYYK